MGYAANEKSSPPKVVVKRVVHATREAVFEAWTNPKLMEQWLYPGAGRATSVVDLRVGGRYDHDMQFDRPDNSCESKGQTADGKYSYPHHGEYLEIARPERLVFTWNSPSVSNTRVTVELREVDDGTEVKITHELLDSEAARAGHTQGWMGCLDNLVLAVERGK